MITRRGILKGLAGLAAGSVGFASYAFGIEPHWRLSVTKYRLKPPRWPADMPLKIAVIADLHTCKPFMTLPRIEEIVAKTNAERADIVFLLGDFTATHRFISGPIPASDWTKTLSALKAPLGVHAILGNHDWWDDREAQRKRQGPVLVRRALEAAGIPVYENDAIRIKHRAKAFWVAGLADQIAFIVGRGIFDGIDDLPGTLAKVTDDAPIILLAHEPDIFTKVPARVSLTLSGHTHGGQVRLFGYSPVVPSQFRNRFAYGHIVEDNRHLVVSGGLGCSIVPVRFGVPPEIVTIDLA